MHLQWDREILPFKEQMSPDIPLRSFVTLTSLLIIRPPVILILATKDMLAQ